MKGLLTTQEAAARLGVTAPRIRFLARTGRLPCTREETPRGPLLWFRAEDVDAFQRLPVGWPKGKKRKE